MGYVLSILTFLSKRRGVDEDCFIQTVLFYKSLIPNLVPEFKWDENAIIEGLIFIKSESRPGRNCKSEQSIKFCHGMHLEGVPLGPGLPKSTSVTQEMDDWCQEFKVRTDAIAQTLFKSYVDEFAKVLLDCQYHRETEMKTADSPMKIFQLFSMGPIKLQSATL